MRASAQESRAERPIDSMGAPESHPGDDPETVIPVAFNDADGYGRGDDDRIVSDISERYPDPSSNDVRDDQLRGKLPCSPAHQ